MPELVPARVENEDVISVPTLLDLDGWLRSHDRSRPAVIHGSKHFSYGEFVDLVDAARGAIGGAGVVAVVMDRSIELVAAVHAVVGSGSVYLPIDPALPDERIRATLSDGGADLVLTDVANLPRIDGIRTVLPTE
ncbi:MAG: AMP-binding protein [Acidimicrobiia bacterium]|nr:AMP-binding protein [Acidimicrobiia bacterium]